MFSCEIGELFKNSFFIEHLWWLLLASGHTYINNQKKKKKKEFKSQFDLKIRRRVTVADMPVKLVRRRLIEKQEAVIQRCSVKMVFLKISQDRN